MAELMNLYPGIAEIVGDGEEFKNFLQKKPLWVLDKALGMLNKSQDLSVNDTLIIFLDKDQNSDGGSVTNYR